MSEEHFHIILDECITRMLKGESLDSCLAAFPEEAERLKPLLRVVDHSRNLPQPEARLEAKRDGKERVLAAARRLQERNKSIAARTDSQFTRYISRVARWLRNLFVGKENAKMKLAYRIAIYTLITIVIGGFFTVNTSAQSLPGDPLYGVKKGWEQVRLSLALSEESQQELEDRFEKNRMEEVLALLEKKKSAKIEFEASIESMEGELWNIGGFDVHVNQDTELEGVLQVGSSVEVEGFTQEDGSILALEIELLTDDGDDDDEDDDIEEMEAYGTLESMSGDSAVVDGISYMITSQTEVEDEVEVGDYVKVEYYENEDGDLILLELEGEDDDQDDDEDDDSEEMEAYGTLESITDNSIVIDGVTYLVTEETDLDDDLEVGDQVKIKFFENEEGDLLLLDIDVESEIVDTPEPEDDDEDDSDGDDDDGEEDEEDEEDDEGDEDEEE